MKTEKRRNEDQKKDDMKTDKRHLTLKKFNIFRRSNCSRYL